MFSLSGKNCLVTGASSGIGRATAQHIASAGGSVTATGRNYERLSVTVDSLRGKGHKVVAADLLDSAQLKDLAEQSPGLDGLVHCAGIARMAPLRFTTEKILRELFAANVETAIGLTRELSKRKRLNDGASILFLSSLSAANGWPGQIAYSATKSALLGVSKTLASELSERHIRCNCVLPGMVRTPMLEGGLAKEQLEADEAKYPLGYGTPADVAGTIVFFMSDASRWITGQALIMDGGASLGG